MTPSSQQEQGGAPDRRVIYTESTGRLHVLPEPEPRKYPVTREDAEEVAKAYGVELEVHHGE